MTRKAWAESIVTLTRQRVLLRHPLVAALFITVSLAAIVAQQRSFLLLTQDPDPYYRNVLNLGASYQRFFAFFYYFGGFPVNLDRQQTRTQEETVATLQQLGPRLTPESGIYNRASIFLFYPDAWMKGRPDTAEMRTGHAVWFTCGLIALFLALCLAGRPLLGAVAVLLCGSDPFQVYELYHVSSSTIFPTVISTGLFVMASCVLLSTERMARSTPLSLALVAINGVVCALQYEIRLEGVGVFLGAIFSLVVCFRHRAVMKGAMAAVFVATLLLTNTALDRYFAASFARANQVVVEYGGRAAPAGNPYYATQWWALWSGLGDFDEKYGFLADDRAGVSYYYGHGLNTISERAHRTHYLETVAADPAWFADIMFRRLTRVLADNTPYRLSYGQRFVDLPIPAGLVTIAALALLGAVLLLARSADVRSLLNLFVLPLAIGAVAVGQLADYGLQFYAVAHLFALAYVGCVAIEMLLVAARVTPETTA